MCKRPESDSLLDSEHLFGSFGNALPLFSIFSGELTRLIITSHKYEEDIFHCSDFNVGGLASRRPNPNRPQVHQRQNAVVRRREAGDLHPLRNLFGQWD